MKAINLLRALLGLLNHRTWGPFVETFQASRFDHAISVSWAQAGEDLALISALAGIDKGRYIDVGAHHPSRFSVTRVLYERGWTGINIEGNSDLIAKFEKERARDINLNYCVGNSTDYSFHIFEEPALSTVSNDWKNRFLQENQNLSETRTVKGVKLSKIVTQLQIVTLSHNVALSQILTLLQTVTLFKSVTLLKTVTILKTVTLLQS